MKYDLIKQRYSSMQQRLINEEYKNIKENYKIKMILYFFLLQHFILCKFIIIY